MSLIPWGKPTIKITTSTAGAPGSSWKAIDTPKEETTKLTTELGEEVEATEEGGAVVDSYRKKGKATLEFTLFLKKGLPLPWTDEDGIIAGEHAIQVIPEDPTATAIQIDSCKLSCRYDYTSKDGTLVTYTAKALKPKTGNMVKYIVIGG